jgi:hypothetical protein
MADKALGGAVVWFHKVGTATSPIPEATYRCPRKPLDWLDLDTLQKKTRFVGIAS